MRAGDSAPSGTDTTLGPAGASDLLVAFVDVDNALAKIEGSVLLAVDAVHLQQRGVLMLVPKSTFVAREDGLDIESPGAFGPSTSTSNRRRGFLFLGHFERKFALFYWI